MFSVLRPIISLLITCSQHHCHIRGGFKGAHIVNEIELLEMQKTIIRQDLVAAYHVCPVELVVVIQISIAWNTHAWANMCPDTCLRSAL